MYPTLYEAPKPELIPLPSRDQEVPGIFWIPSSAFVTELSDYLESKSVLEVFAGNGLLAGHLASNGVHVTATSILSSMDGHERGVYHPVENLKASTAVEKYGLTHDVLLMCWATVTMDALRAAEAWGPGRNIVFIGEVTDYTKNHLGGCATDEFFEAIEVVHRFEHHRLKNMLEQAFVCRLKV